VFELSLKRGFGTIFFIAQQVYSGPGEKENSNEHETAINPYPGHGLFSADTRNSRPRGDHRERYHRERYHRERYHRERFSE